MNQKLRYLIVPIILVLSFSLSFAGGHTKKGKALFNDPSLGTNGKSCASCHPDGRGINGQKKTFSIMGNKMNSIQEAVNFCIQMALKGKPLASDSEEMKALVGYLKTLKGVKKKKRLIKGC